jgi:hypothetical protein
MGERHLIQFFDDLIKSRTGQEVTDGVYTVYFYVEGRWYAADFGPDSREEYGKALLPFREVARPVRGPGRGKKASGPPPLGTPQDTPPQASKAAGKAAVTERNAQIKAWALTTGRYSENDIPRHGRTPAVIIEDFYSSNPDVARLPTHQPPRHPVPAASAAGEPAKPQTGAKPGTKDTPGADHPLMAAAGKRNADLAKAIRNWALDPKGGGCTPEDFPGWFPTREIRDRCLAWAESSPAKARKARLAAVDGKLQLVEPAG